MLVERLIATVRMPRVIAVALAAVLLLPPTSPAHAQVTPGQPIQAPANGALLGLYVQPDTGWMRSDVEAAILGTESAIGRSLDIDHHFAPWGTSFPNWKGGWDQAHGRLSMFTWGDVDTSVVASGAEDDYIRARAQDMRAFGQPIFLRWFGEMDADAKADKAGPPATFINAWRRIHGIFRAEGATNVTFVWSPTAWGFATGKAQTYYPGDAYVDWTAADGYNWAPGNPSANWSAFSSIFAAYHQWGLQNGKPMMVAETGAQERHPGEKAGWLLGALDALRSQLTGIKALVYFDAYASDFSGRMYDWRIDTSQSSLSAFASIAADPFFAQQAASVLPGSGDGAELSATPSITVSKKPWAKKAKRVLKVRARRSFRATAIVGNPGSGAGEMKLIQAGRRKGIRIRYRLGPMRGKGKRFELGSVEAGDERAVRLRVRLRRGVPAGKVLRVRLIAKAMDGKGKRSRAVIRVRIR